MGAFWEQYLYKTVPRCTKVPLQAKWPHIPLFIPFRKGTTTKEKEPSVFVPYNKAKSFRHVFVPYKKVP